MSPCGKRSKAASKLVSDSGLSDSFKRRLAGMIGAMHAPTCQGQAPSSCRTGLKSSGTRLFTQRTLTRPAIAEIYPRLLVGRSRFSMNWYFS